MKILNLYFKNINSLEGESRIHFDKAPIVDGGVFAITGPNGSGKSSVLDAITLGLYGETFRFDRPAEHVMTKATTESFAEVEFALGDDKFKASWHVKRKNDDAKGELLPTEMQLVQLNGSEQVLEDSTQKVRERMAELTGMDFHKFSKSMVLAQGDFSAFLNALDSERMDILEKISGSDIYEDYRRQAEEKHSQAETLLQQLEQDLVATPVMDEQAKEASEHDLADFQEQQAELETEQVDIQQQLAWVQNIASLEKQTETIAKQQQEAKEQQQDTQQTLNQIESSKQLLELEDELTAVDNKTDALQQSNKTLNAYRSEAETLQNQLKSKNFDTSAEVTTQSLSQQKESIEKITLTLSDLKFSLPKETAVLESLELQKNQKNTELTNIEAWLQEKSADKALLDKFPEITELTQARSELSELTKKQSSSAKWTKDTTTALAKKRSEIAEIESKNSRLKEQIIENEKDFKDLTEGTSLEDIQEMQAEQQERVFNFQELFELAGVNSKLGKKSLFGQIFGSKNEGKEEKQLKKEREQLQLLIGREQNVIKTLESAVLNEALLKKMEADRQHLVGGKPCPLCGALKHPYAEHAPATSNSKQVLIEQQKKIKTLVAEEVSLGKQIVLVQQQAEKDGEKEGKLKNVKAQWTALANKLNTLSMELDIDNLSLMKDLLKAEKKELVNISNLLKKASKLDGSIKQARESIEVNSVSLTRVIEENEKLTAEWDNRPKESIDLEQAYTQSVEKEKALSGKVEAQLNLVGEKMPAKGKEDAFFKVLNDRKQAYLTHSQSLKPLAAELKQLDEKIIASSENIKTINQSIKQYADEVQQEELAGLHLSLIEKQKLMVDKETVLAQQEAELTVLKQTLKDKAKDTVAGDLTVLRETLELIHSQEAVKQKQSQLVEKISALENKEQQIKAQLESEQAIKLTEQTEYDLTGRQGVIKRKLDMAKQEVATIQNKLNKQEGMQQKQQELAAKIADQRKALEDSEVDKKLVSAENGINFRRKVQQVISDKLMTESNQILEKISGRYYLRKVDSEHGLALEIEDTKQNNVRRLPKTLSGGESFIVSLALALGLAEMSNNGHAVDSLFLDEGFGNLDAESLYLAMTTLESLKTHGKVVGVISHVEGVQKRIKTQIEMTKKPNGLSALKMVS